ncbi:hypothetical protein BKA81DRAFT_345604 [Phyllosticta paracitricarpa]
MPTSPSSLETRRRPLLLTVIAFTIHPSPSLGLPHARRLPPFALLKNLLTPLNQTRLPLKPPRAPAQLNLTSTNVSSLLPPPTT